MHRFQQIRGRLLARLVIGTLLFAGAGAHAATIEVSNVSQLMNAVSSANSAGGNTVISIADGTYSITDTLYVNAPNVTIQGKSGAREKVIIQGTAMAENAQVGNIIRVAASNFKLDGVTLQKAGWHTIQIAGETNADSPVITNCILRDAYEQLLKVSQDPNNPNVVSDNGRVENCLFEYSAGIGPEYYIGGIDAHGSTGWVVRNNTFKNIASPNTSVAEFAIHFWDLPANNNTIERNTIIDCDRGIGFGLQGRGSNGGIIRNNFIYHSNNNDPYADVGIALADSPNTQVYNNTVYFENSMSFSMEYRFTATKNAVFTNNLTNKPIVSRDSGAATLANNVANASASWFKSVSTGDLHLASSVASVVDQGKAVSGLTDDIDGQARSGSIDVGADEFGGATAAVKPNPPTNVQVQ
jgi:hypothetical protein